MAVSSERMQRIMIEVGLGVESKVEDTPEEAAFRERVVEEIDAIEEGAELRIPPELP